jgi:molecular chaperone DnaK (HSP70)
MPQVSRRLQEELGKEPQVHDPDQAVAKGAAVYGQKLSVGRRIRIEIAKELGTSPEEVAEADVAPQVRERAQQTVADEMGMRLPALKKLDDMKVTNVVSHSFGVVAVKRVGSDLQEYISNLVLAQQSLPASRTREYGTVEANQEEVHLRIMETAMRAEELNDLSQGTEIGSAILALSPNLPEGSPVEVMFELNQEGRLNITGKDKSADGKSISATIETNRALSEQEVAKAASRARSVKVTG